MENRTTYSLHIYHFFVYVLFYKIFIMRVIKIKQTIFCDTSQFKKKL